MASVADLVLQTAQQQGVDPRLALEVALQESNLNPAVVSRTGAIGVMQLMPATAAALASIPTMSPKTSRAASAISNSS